ncbi:selenocysteine protein [candidate division KSB1 bacterium]|nr:MAG: selenocysteine protein [candidate division KSB1 bacterium]HDI51190.1 selenocysteine protein [Bacteroidota bacterium]RKY81027.1 MAG: selenocysteine protein [candidate division KSB1 bacterium]RKY85159.1 MAG: selenocysteine protein [candidate division KSB1 bacterium]RKY88100.1 MAG: selenocysteine protein [candidate division KSB1 bacterium]
MGEIWQVFEHAVTITVFVFVAMMVVDYFNVLSEGRLSSLIRGGVWRQYFISSFLGATPGCFGAFLNVSFYVHGLLSFGAMIGGMVATSGDESFVMLALFPKKALLLFGTLFVLGIVFAWISDKIAALLKIKSCQECNLQIVHTSPLDQSLSEQVLVQNFLRISWKRTVLLLGGIIFLIGLTTGIIGPPTWNWEKITLTVLTTIGIAIVGSVSRHHLQEHIWAHIVKRHLWRVFLWSFFAILIVGIGLKYWDLEAFVKAHMVWVMLIAVVIAIIPESGPHLIFVMMFAQGLIPFSVLLASSIVQDGHGMLPLLSYTVRDSVLIKAFNFIFGLAVGLILYVLGV